MLRNGRQSFCDQVDSLLKQYQSKVLLPTILILGGVALGFLLFGLGSWQSTQSFWISSLIPVAMVIFVGSPIAGIFWMVEITTKSIADIQRVCEQAEFHNVTVYYKEEKFAYTDYNSNHSRRYQTKCFLEFIYGTAPATTTTTFPVAVATAEPIYAFAEAEIPVYSDNTGKSGYNNNNNSSVGVPLGDGSTTTTYASAPPPPPPPPLAPTSSLSAKERLQELEEIKSKTA